MRIDPFIVMILGLAGLGIVLPAQGTVLEVVSVLVQVGIVALFFLYGARLSTGEVVHGLKVWRVHAVIVVSTFVLFPLLGLALSPLAPALVSQQLLAALVFVCLVPSTVQSSVAFTSIAGGDRAIAVVAASVSSLLGVFLTPLLVALMLGGDVHVDARAVLRIIGLLLLPFLAGQVARRWLRPWLLRHDVGLRRFDRSTVLLVVYAGFSRGTNADVWQVLDWTDGLVVAAVCVALLAVSSAVCWFAGRRFGRGAQVAVYFCGTNKSLAAGLPMASVLFSAATFPLMILPLMVYHQLQLIVGSVIATRLSADGRSVTP
ncbi:bile acid:sodium symporter family protein [Aeromicrobium duanguangcaii]|uniref:Bile acid:sodium symporter n=1 Tax=Aeromicrobium duanguangcaii TaxID=2968086 RepID=A0ABY5KEX4_9ACTN|nr:bile acid:sodium symporter family protein [Aeromicrobium duanguangcaii]MCD9154053.1 bile acid:sodium symporter [Aeromicrobium duanguangcaii]UUI68870.1 bile acid:sodium symporter [Aeromicrobium duanguangcaii]